MSNIYDDIYKQEEYYWGFKPAPTCFKVLQALPPVKKLKLLDIGCGEGRNAAFFARNGYDVTAFDLADAGVEKTKKLADKIGVKVKVFKANINEYRLTDKFDIIFSVGTLQYIPKEFREEIITNYKDHTKENGIHMLSVFVKKPFIEPAPEGEKNSHKWISGELLTYYHDWMIEYSTEEIFDCMSSGIPHKHATNRVLARKTICLKTK
ncbi:MAG: methyltransferase domain-containing protein [Candidatus Edwardsbacteria bacterium]|nr:methyltransferase domain-containing protein [Candidatus Edwardsbacteria bacterium]